MNKKIQKSSGKKNSNPRRKSTVELNQQKPKIYVPSEEDKKVIKKIQQIYHSDEGGVVTLHYEVERFNLQKNKSYKIKWKQSFPITPHMYNYEKMKLERVFLRVFLNIKAIARDRGAKYFTIN